MSDHTVWIVDFDVSLADAETTAQRVLEHLVRIEVVQPHTFRRPYSCEDLYLPGSKAQRYSEQVDECCGLLVEYGRNVYHSGCNGQVDTMPALCPRCHTWHPAGRVAWLAAIQPWLDAVPGEGVLCPTCTRNSALEEWDFGEWGWAFGNLGFGFRNWPVQRKLAEELAAASGHRMRIVYECI